jgi:hypothetical protein
MRFAGKIAGWTPFKCFAKVQIQAAPTESHQSSKQWYV